MQMSQNSTIQHCVEACLQCHKTCLQMAMTYCLPEGGQHIEAQHFRLMLNCAEMCQTSANLMMSNPNNSHVHTAVCVACAEICEMCMQSCQEIGNMEACVEACRQCADTCEIMVGAAGIKEYRNKTKDSSTRTKSNYQ